jgi:ribonuclease P protein component
VYKRVYSLKSRYNFNKVFREGRAFKGSSLIIIFLRNDEKTFSNDSVDKKFAVVVSSKISKKAVIKNRVRRIIGEAIRLNIDKFPPYHYYVFIPKKEVINDCGKVDNITKKVNIDINTFLSELVVL